MQPGARVDFGAGCVIAHIHPRRIEGRKLRLRVRLLLGFDLDPGAAGPHAVPQREL